VSELPTKPIAALASVHTDSLTEILNRLGASLLISTYQAGKVVVARVEKGVINTHFRAFETPMGMACANGRLAIGCRTRTWDFRNQPDVARNLEPSGKHDAVFLPRNCHFTGNIHIHEIAWGGVELWIANTRFSCLCTIDREHSFVPRWRPSFVSGLSPEDRCHLNGLGMRDGKPGYVTALGQTDGREGWRVNKRDGGCLIDVTTGAIIAERLSMPHSPRWHGGRLWLLESGLGQISVVDLPTGKREVVARLPGFTRGLDFAGPFAFIGLSQVRETAVFGGLPITEGDTERNCGVWVVDVRNGQTVAFLKFQADVQEIFAVQVLQGLRFPEIVTADENALLHSFVLPDDCLMEVRFAHSSGAR
jgi:uncharacterized protein (TIGR03032 family)